MNLVFVLATLAVILLVSVLHSTSSMEKISRTWDTHPTAIRAAAELQKALTSIQEITEKAKQWDFMAYAGFADAENFALDNSNYSWPFVSGDFFRSISDHVFLTSQSLQHLPNLTIRPFDIIFIKADFSGQLGSFQKTNKKPYFVITHDGAISNPRQGKHLLNDPYLLRWFAQNTDTVHAKLESIPLGIANARWKHGNQTNILQATSRPFESREIKFYVNHSNKTNPRRGIIWNIFCGSESPIKATCISKKLKSEEYLDDLGNSQLVLSPPGQGIDCHRTWEALALGSIPVVENSSISSLYEGERVLVVNKFEKVTKELFETERKRLKEIPFENSRIFTRYYRNRFAELRQQNQISWNYPE